jgi:hypothetical protein
MFPSWSRSVLTILAIASAFTDRVHAAPVLMAEDTFTYSTGSIVERSGGTGWASAWVNPYSQSPLIVDVSGRLTFDSDGDTIDAAGRTLGTRFSGASFSKVYITFDVEFGSQSGFGTPNLRIRDTTLGGVTTAGLGNNGYSSNYAILGANLVTGADSGVTLSTPANILFEVDYVQGQSRLWVGLGSSPWDSAAFPSTSADATFAVAPTFDTLDLYVRELSYFDNLRVYAVAVPEPTTYGAVAGLVALGITVRRRRRLF